MAYEPIIDRVTGIRDDGTVVRFIKAYINSGDYKPTLGIEIGSSLFERDTGKLYLFTDKGKWVVPDDEYSNTDSDHIENHSNVVGSSVSDAFNTLLDKKISFPVFPDSKYGESGQLLRTKGDGQTEWADYGLPTNEQTSEALASWLNDHPEATTTVEDGSLTELKFTDLLKLKTLKDYVTPEMYGAAGDGITDDTDEILAAVASGKAVFLYNDYLISDTIILNNDKRFYSYGKIIYAGARTKPAVKITGKYNDVSLNVIVDTASNAINSMDGGWHGWESDDYSGIELYNCYYSKLFVNRIINFTCGLKMVAEGATSVGNYNNTISGKIIMNCKYGIYFITSGKGWMNTNTISGFLISTGSRNTDIYRNSQEITTYGVYQTVANDSGYGLAYCSLDNLAFEIVTKSTFIGFYFKLARLNRIRNLVSEIASGAIFALFDMYYPREIPLTDNDQSVDNIFINAQIMGGSSEIVYENAGLSAFSLLQIAKHDNIEWFRSFYDDKFVGNAINIDNNNHSSIKGYSFSQRNSTDDLDTNKFARSSYSKVNNSISSEEIIIGTNYCLSLMIPVVHNDTYRIMVNGGEDGLTSPNMLLKVFDANKQILEPTSAEDKALCGRLSYNASSHAYGAISGNLKDAEFSIGDQTISYVMVLVYGAVKSIEIQKAGSYARVFRHWGNLNFVNYLGNDKFMSNTKPTSSINNETNYVGQRVYKADLADHIGQYWELTSEGWV